MKTKTLRYALFALILCILIVYLAFHTFFSKNSLSEVPQLKSQIAIYNNQLKDLNQTIENLKIKIELLHCQSNPDLDLLEEQAKQKLGLINKNEKIMYQ